MFCLKAFFLEDPLFVTPANSFFLLNKEPFHLEVKGNTMEISIPCLFNRGREIVREIKNRECLQRNKLSQCVLPC